MAALPGLLDSTWMGRELVFYDGICHKIHGFYIERQVTGSMMAVLAILLDSRWGIRELGFF